jgi:hypothetical protein
VEIEWTPLGAGLRAASQGTVTQITQLVA